VSHLRLQIMLAVLLAAANGCSLADECPAIGARVKSQTPVELYQAMAACARQSQYETASWYFALAGVYGRFDTYRVSDETAYSAVAIVKSAALETIPQAKREEFQKFVMSISSDPDKHRAVCKKISPLGPPAYEPTYMKAHGPEAISGAKTAAPAALAPFDPHAAWQKALSSYASCEAG
jgi:hypothetical protein